MRSIVPASGGALELNYMWLPTFIGMNAVLKKEMEAELQESLRGIPLTEHGLDEAHQRVLEYLVKKFPDVKGLDLYLDGLKFVEL